MFRKMRREKQALSEERCIEILKGEVRGVLAMIGDGGYPYAVPIDHWYCEEDGRIYFHGGPVGHRLDAIRADDRVCYTVYDSGFRKDGDWALNISSVVVFGRASIVEDKERAMEAVRQICLKFTSDEAYIAEEFARSAASTVVVALTPEHMTGKLVNEK